MYRKLKAFALNAVLAVTAVILGGVVVEGMLRALYPASERHYVLAPHQTIILTPLPEYVPGVTEQAAYRTSSLGIRGAELDDRANYRILAIGGSTTQNGYLDQEVTWPILTGALLNRQQDGIRTWSGDVGRSGHTSRSHLLQLQKLLPELPRIDAVVMLVGVNDLTVALRQGFDYKPPRPLSDPEAYREQMREAFVQVPGRLHNRLTDYQSEGIALWKRTALVQLARQVRHRLVETRGGTRQDRFGEIFVQWRSHRAGAHEIFDTLPDLTAPLATYRFHLSQIAEASKDMGVRIVFLTQPVLWRADLSPNEEALLWLGGTGNFQEEPGHAYFSARALWEAMNAYNQALLQVCEDHSVECFDLASALPADTSNFYDDVHFTEKGSRTVASLLADYLSDRPPYGGFGSSKPASMDR